MSRNTKKDSWIVVGFDACGYTRRALQLLTNYNKKFVYLKISPSDKENAADIKYFKTELKPIAARIAPHHETFPFVFHNMQFVGGYSDLLGYMQGQEKKEMRCKDIKKNFNPVYKFIKDTDVEEEDEDDYDEQEFRSLMKILKKKAGNI